MKVLQLFPYVPTPPTFGGALRVYHILKHLTENYDVTVAGYNEYGDMEAFEKSFPILNNKMHFRNVHRKRTRRLRQVTTLFTKRSYWYRWTYSNEMQRMLNELLDSADFDFILTEFASMGHFDLPSDAIKILDAHNVEYDNFRRMSTLDWSLTRKKFYEREYRKTFQEEVAVFKKQDAIFSTSSRDRDIIQQHSENAQHFVIPNGVDTQYFQPRNIQPEPYSMVFTGAMGYVPNNDGIMFFLDKIFPKIKNKIPEAKVYVVGNNPPKMLLKKQSRDVIITGFVDDVRPWIDRASVYIVPLNMGSGTRLKVVEAMSMEKPIVSTSIGCEGIEVVNGEHLLVRDEPEAFAEAVVELMHNRALSNRLVENGRDLVKSKYDWNVIGEHIDDALNYLLQRKKWTNAYPREKKEKLEVIV